MDAMALAGRSAMPDGGDKVAIAVEDGMVDGIGADGMGAMLSTLGAADVGETGIAGMAGGAGWVGAVIAGWLAARLDAVSP